VLGGLAQARGDQQGTELVTVEPGGMRLIIQARAADMGGGGMVEQVFLDGVSVESVPRLSVWRALCGAWAGW
jgi:hypothetical protein